MSGKEVKNGDLLLAEPFMWDPHFKKSVVFICEHHEAGTIGFILNKPVGMSVHDLLSISDRFEAEVFYGGPVQTDTIHYLHTKGDIIDNAVEVASGVYWGGDFETLKFCIENQLILPDEIKFFVGYSGWGEKQLEEEMEINSWLLTESDRNYIFSGPESSVQLWSRVLKNVGGHWEIIAEMGNPTYN